MTLWYFSMFHNFILFIQNVLFFPELLITLISPPFLIAKLKQNNLCNKLTIFQHLFLFKNQNYYLMKNFQKLLLLLRLITFYKFR